VDPAACLLPIGRHLSLLKDFTFSFITTKLDAVFNYHIKLLFLEQFAYILN